MSERRSKERLFIYGSLQPGGPNAHVIDAIGGDWEPATVRGKLVQRGWAAEIGYPGLVLDDKEGEIAGYIFTSTNLSTKWAELDDFEGAEYERIVTRVTLSGGERVRAHVYVLRTK